MKMMMVQLYLTVCFWGMAILQTDVGTMIAFPTDTISTSQAKVAYLGILTEKIHIFL